MSKHNPLSREGDDIRYNKACGFIHTIPTNVSVFCLHRLLCADGLVIYFFPLVTELSIAVFMYIKLLLYSMMRLYEWFT